MVRRFKILIVLISVLFLGACQLSQPVVAVTVYPVEYLVRRIAGDRVETRMLSEGITITRAQAHPEFSERLSQSNVVFYFGQLEPYVVLVQPELQASRLPLVNLTTQAGVYRFQRYTTTLVNGAQVTQESAYYEGAAFAHVDMYETDPILWLDPITMLSMAGTLRNWLVTNFPEERSLFNRNYEQLELELARLDASYQELRFRDIAFVSVTPSFGNWQRAYGIRVYPLMLSRFGVLPTEQQLQLMLSRIAQDGVRTIALEPNLTPDMMELFTRVRDELELDVIELHNLSFLTQADREANKNYLTIMYENLNALETINP